jgi:hypothetical protein
MYKILNCSKCESKAILRKNRLSPSLKSGNKRKRPVHQFYVECLNCSQMSEWFDSSANKAINDWNKRQKTKNYR